MKIGLLGLGRVGGAVAVALHAHHRVLEERAGVPPVVARIAVRHLHKPRPIVIDRALLTDDTWAVVTDPAIDVIIEAIGGLRPAGDYLEAALRLGKRVITANKQLVSARGDELDTLARRVGGRFAFEACVGGAVPVVRVLRDSLAGDVIHSLLAVINGTANFILSRMEHEVSFDEALAMAISLGLAEPDPTDDLDAHDAAAKLAIMGSLAFGVKIRAAQIPHQGIRQITHDDIARAQAAGGAIRLVAAARRRDGRIEAGVFPATLPQSHPLARLQGEANGLLLRSDLAGEVFLRGRGAGGVATASAILGDLVDVLRRPQMQVWSNVVAEVVPLPPDARAEVEAFTGAAANA